MDHELQFHLDLEAEPPRTAGAHARRGAHQARCARSAASSSVREECRERAAHVWVDTLRAQRRATRARCAPAASPATRLLADRDARPRHRRQHRDLQRHQRRAAEAAAVRGRRSAGPRPAVGAAGRTGRRRRVDPRSSTTTASSSNDFDGLVEFHQMSFDLLNRGEPDRVNTGVVSANFFDVLGVEADARPDLRRGRRCARRGGGAGPQPRVLADALRRRPDDRRPGVRDERPAAHRRRRAAADVPQYPQELRRLHADSACPFRARGEQQMAEAGAARSAR